MKISKIIIILLCFYIIYYIYNNSVKIFVNCRKFTFNDNNTVISLLNKIPNNNIKNLDKCNSSQVIIQKHPMNITDVKKWKRPVGLHWV